MTVGEPCSQVDQAGFLGDEIGLAEIPAFHLPGLLVFPGALVAAVGEFADDQVRHTPTPRRSPALGRRAQGLGAGRVVRLGQAQKPEAAGLPALA